MKKKSDWLKRMKVIHPFGIYGLDDGTFALCTKQNKEVNKGGEEE